MGAAPNANGLGSEVDPLAMIDDKKRKKMDSNRESARRSRMRKQKQLEGLLAQESQLRGANKKLVDAIGSVREKYLAVEKDNSGLRARVLELTERLRLLNSVLEVVQEVNGITLDIPEVPEMVTRRWQLPCPVQTIAATSVEPFSL